MVYLVWSGVWWILTSWSYYIYSPEGLRANSGYTLWAQRTAFTRSAITPPKVNRFWWNLEHGEPDVGGWTWQTLGVIHPVATVFFVWLITHDFSDFPSEKFYNILTQKRQTLYKISVQNFEYFTVRGHFKKCKSCCKNLQVLRVQAVMTPHWLKMPKTHG